MIADRTLPGKFRRPRRVVKAPETTGGAFEQSFPGLIEGFDQIVVEPRLRGESHETPHIFRLGNQRRHRSLAGSAFARKSGFADEDRFVRKTRLHAVDRRPHNVQSPARRFRLIFPIGQNVDGDEIDRVREFAGRRQPEIGDVGISDRKPGLLLHVARERRHRRRGLLAAQQDLVADNDGLDCVAKFLGERKRQSQLHPVVLFVAADPDPEQHLESVLFRKRHRRGQSLVGGVKADAIRKRRDEL